MSTTSDKETMSTTSDTSQGLNDNNVPLHYPTLFPKPSAFAVTLTCVGVREDDRNIAGNVAKAFQEVIGDAQFIAGHGRTQWMFEFDGMSMEIHLSAAHAYRPTTEEEDELQMKSDEQAFKAFKALKA